jgi:dolichol-phosphate mannosyltransferase
MSKLITVILPVFNEEKNLPVIYRELAKVAEGLSQYQWQFVLVDDGSTDRSAKVLAELAGRDSRVKVLELSRNFGKEVATTAGLHLAPEGAAVIMMDADGQHPPRFIPDMLKKWEKGADIVIGVRRKNPQASLGKRMGSWMFYKISNMISETKMKKGETDFRLLDPPVVAEYKKFTERNRMTRSLIDWLGFKRDYFYFDAPGRQEGEPGYGYFKLTKLALSSFVAHSFIPLKLAGYLGIIIIIVFGFLGLFILVERYILGDPLALNISGPAQLAVIVAFLIGIVLSCLGLIALYIGNIHDEVSNRPLYVVRRKLNLSREDE